MTAKASPRKGASAPAKPATVPPKVPVQVAPAVPPAATTLFPLSRLRRAPENVRHTAPDEDIAILADDVAAHGLLQSLIGYFGNDDPGAGAVMITAGGRRLQALHWLLDDDRLTLAYEVPVLVRPREEAIELSLSENLQKRDMNPADEFVAFKALMDLGTHSPGELAKRFGFSEQYVKQRLRLAELVPEVLDALRRREMTLGAALAYVKAADPELQRKVFKTQAKRSWEPHKPENIRHAVAAESKTTDWQLFRFIGAEAYERAGGGYEDTGLFDESEGGARKLTAAATVLRVAGDHVDFQMLRRLPEMADELELPRDQVVGFVKLDGLEIGQWFYAYQGLNKQKVDDFAWVGEDYNPDRVKRMLKTIRNNRIEVRLPVGIDTKGELVLIAKGFFVPKDQVRAIDPPVEREVVPQKTPLELEIERRQAAIRREATKLGIGSLVGTPLEGRAFFPKSDWSLRPFEQHTDPEAGAGVLVALQVFVPEASIAALLGEGEKRLDERLAAEADAREARERAETERKKAAEARVAELRAMDPPSVAVVDGEAWVRDDLGGYEVLESEEDTYLTDWIELVGHYGVQIELTYDDRAAFDAEMAAARPALAEAAE